MGLRREEVGLQWPWERHQQGEAALRTPSVDHPELAEEDLHRFFQEEAEAACGHPRGEQERQERLSSNLLLP